MRVNACKYYDFVVSAQEIVRELPSSGFDGRASDYERLSEPAVFFDGTAELEFSVTNG